MHKVPVPSKNIRTDLILEQEKDELFKSKTEVFHNIKVTSFQKEKGMYTTIEFQDITEQEERKNIEKVLMEELTKYIKPTSNDIYLVVGLGNPKSTPDSLGPKTLDEILVTRYLFLLGQVEESFSNVSILKPDVCGNTGIESVHQIKDVIKDIKPTKVIVIDSLKASTLERLVKTIQITDTGIHPGSGIMNDQGEISQQTVKTKVIAIGIPTVVDKNTMLGKDETDNYMVTPTNIDFVIDRLSKLLGNVLNRIFHKTFFDK